MPRPLYVRNVSDIRKSALAGFVARISAGSNIATLTEYISLFYTEPSRKLPCYYFPVLSRYDWSFETHFVNCGVQAPKPERSLKIFGLFFVPVWWTSLTMSRHFEGMSEHWQLTLLARISIPTRHSKLESLKGLTCSWMRLMKSAALASIASSMWACWASCIAWLVATTVVARKATVKKGCAHC